MPELNVGDIVYELYHSEVVSKHTVVRVTKTKAVLSENIECKRQYVEGYLLSELGSKPYDVSGYVISDDKYNKLWDIKLFKDKAINELSSIIISVKQIKGSNLDIDVSKFFNFIEELKKLVV